MKKFFSNAWFLTKLMVKDPGIVIPYTLGSLFNLFIFSPFVLHEQTTLVDAIFKLLISMLIMPLMIFIMMVVVGAGTSAFNFVKEKCRAK